MKKLLSIFTFILLLASCDSLETDKGNDNTDDSGTVPYTPSGVSAYSRSPTTIRISWNAVPNATNYKVYYSSSAEGEFYDIGGYITYTSYEDTSCQPEETWYYKISAVNKYGESGKSRTVSATTPLLY